MSVGSIDASKTPLVPPTLPRKKSAQAPPGSTLIGQSTKNTTASLEGRIRIAREQLNDWVTCVSATTPKGQAEIRSLSAQISAAQEQINRLRPSDSVTSADQPRSTGATLDVWA